MTCPPPLAAPRVLLAGKELVILFVKRRSRTLHNCKHCDFSIRRPGESGHDMLLEQPDSDPLHDARIPQRSLSMAL